MYCARCGALVGPDAKQCPGCRADLWGSGALRLTPPKFPAQSLADVFGEDAPHLPQRRSGSQVDGDADATRVIPRVEADDATVVLPAVTDAPAEPAQPAVAAPTAVPAARASSQFRPGEPRPSTAGEPVGQLKDEDDPREDAVTANHAARLWVMLAVATAVAVFAAIGVWRMLDNTFNRPSAPPTAAAPAASAAPAQSGAAVKKPVASKAAVTPSATPTASAAATRPVTGTLPSSATKCSETVGAGKGTSCQFALAVAAKLPPVPADDFSLDATSPVTGRSYAMHCTAGAITVCTGGRAAVVYVLK